MLKDFMNSTPLVSVIVITYNHAPYIERCLLSILEQKTNFDVEILVGEDCSTDNTAEEIRKIERKFPGRLTCLYRKPNLGMTKNFTDLLERSQGEFLAICEGDDFWNDPSKLQKQVNYLEAHPECSFCFHDAYRIDGDGIDLPKYPGFPSERSVYTRDLLVANFVPTPSLCHRNYPLKEFPQWLANGNLPMFDWPLLVYLSTKGYGHYIPEAMATYRVHSQGVWSGSSSRQKAVSLQAFHSKMMDVMPTPLNRISRRQLSNTYLKLSALGDNTLREEWLYFVKSFRVLSPLDWGHAFTARLRRGAKMLLHLARKPKIFT
jgi:glycosyltransferase involved in cell wall biosynthesis